MPFIGILVLYSGNPRINILYEENKMIEFVIQMRIGIIVLE